MSNNIPIEIQMEIIKKVYDVKSLVRFRSVSKSWKSIIDSSEFIKGYGAHNTRPHSHILSLPTASEDRNFICLVEDDNKTFEIQEQEFAPFVQSPLLKHYKVNKVVGACHGLLCLHGYHYLYKKEMLVIWNPLIGKSFGIVNPSYLSYAYNYGFRVCPVTKDPTVVKIIVTQNKPWHVEVFTLSSRVWNVTPCSTLPHKSIIPDQKSHVVLDRFIYWGACENISTDNGAYITNHMLVSFDLITKEFKLVYLPDSLTNELDEEPVSVSKLRDSLVVYGYFFVGMSRCCGVWVLEHNSSFRKLYTIRSPVYHILGFRKSGEPIFVYVKGLHEYSVYVYNPSSKRIKNLKIDGEYGSFFMDSYKESLILLDHSDSHIYYYN